MRIAQVSPLYESVPPTGYGGTERVVSYLTEELVRLGHDVTLFASGDSQTAARLISPCPRSLRLDNRCIDPLAHHMLLMELVRRHADEFDIIHFHIDYLHFPLSRQAGWAHVTTLHGRLDLPDLPSLYRVFSDAPLVSISDAQRTPLAWANWQATVYHGLPLDLHRPGFRAEPYLAFLGRICIEKRVDRAIEIARRTGLRLKIAAKVDKADRQYYEEQIKPLLADPLVEYIGEVGGREKDEFVRNAAVLLFPIDWPEPFGLAMIEAMACGTPVVGWRCGSVPEVIDDGHTGYIVDSLEEAVAAVPRAMALDRLRVRAKFEERFSAARMARDYLAVYERLLAERPAPALRLSLPPARERLGQPDGWQAAADGWPSVAAAAPAGAAASEIAVRSA
jgi:glycosyltransferase involved in cell wall biosynthesis